MKEKVKLSKKCRKDLLKKPNVVGVGVGYREKDGKRIEEQSIVVFVEKKIARTDLRREEILPHTLKGQQVDVIEIGEVRLLDEDEDSQSKGGIGLNKTAAVKSSSDRLKRYRPAPGGVSIGHYKITAGTLGAVVRDKSSGARMILSNNHVLANSSSGKDNRAAPGDNILQPGTFDGGKQSADIIGHLERFVPIQRTVYRSQCASAKAAEGLANWLLSRLLPQYQIVLTRANQQGNLVDAALAVPLQEKDLADNILELGNAAGTADVFLGQPIRFSGRTSGLVSGKVIAKDVSLYITMNPGEQVLFEQQVITSAVSRPGDSGSLVVDETNKAVGLLFAGSDKVSICNKIDNICRMLNIEI